MPKKKLTKKQKLFVDEYLIDLNATQAAIRAGYKEKTAYSMGWQNLKKLEVQQSIEKAMQKREDRTEITQDRVLRELEKIGFSDLRGAFNENGSLKMPKDWSDEAAAAISSIEVITKNLGEGEVEYVHKIKLWDKKGGLELIGKHLKMFTDKVEATLDQREPFIIEKENAKSKAD